MKTAVYILILILFSVALTAQTYTLDDILNRIATEIDGTIPAGTNLAILNFNSPTEAFSDYVIEELTVKLVRNPSLTIVDRQNISLINKEQNLQLSGEVSDASAVAIGRLLGAQSIITGNLTNTGDVLRFRIRAVNVETGAIQTQIALNLRSDSQVAFLLGASTAGTTTTTTTTTPNSNTTSTPNPNEPPIQGITAQGNTFADKLRWLIRNADSNNTYILIATANESIAPQTFDFRGATNVTVVLRGDAVNRVIKLSSNGTMFTLNSDVTLVLDNNITLQGHERNTGSIVCIENQSTLKMRTGSTITGNRYAGTGGGVVVRNGSFIMSGGTISNNTAVREGGLTGYGGGVIVWWGDFTMSGGTISGNTAYTYGGGVCVEFGSFTMTGGTITGNSAREYGGGVYCGSARSFVKRGGIITGYASDPENGNAVRDEDGTIARKGHAAFRHESLRRETTAGPNDRLSTENNDTPWE